MSHANNNTQYLSASTTILARLDAARKTEIKQHKKAKAEKAYAIITGKVQ